MEDKKRSLAKAVSWRLTGTVATVGVALLITGSWMPAIQIGLIELFTKMLLYYAHERVWSGLVWGIDPWEGTELAPRSAAKSLTWRICGTVDTIIISLLITGTLELALEIGLLEWFSKLIIFYIHERVWSQVLWGIRQPDTQSELNETILEPIKTKGPILETVRI